MAIITRAGGALCLHHWPSTEDERLCVGERIRHSQVSAQLLDEATYTLERHTRIAVLVQKPSLDKLAPGNRTTPGRIWSDDRLPKTSGESRPPGICPRLPGRRARRGQYLRRLSLES
jgi:hypothetical protein